MNTKKARAFSPPSPRPRALSEEEVKKMAMKKLTDPNYEPGNGVISAPEASESPVEAIPAQEAPVELPVVEKTPQTTSEPAEDIALTAIDAPESEGEAPKFPWDDLTGLKVTNLLYEIPPETVAKMNWVMDNVPKQNRQRIVRDGVAAELERLIAKHYKP